MSELFVILSGCSGGGKSALLEALRRRGHAVVEEPGRRIVRQELAAGGTALPWRDLAAFARRAVEMALADRAAMRGQPGFVFFDRGLIDAAVALEAAGGGARLSSLTSADRFSSPRPGRKSMPATRSAGTALRRPAPNTRGSKAPIRGLATCRSSCRRRRWRRAPTSCWRGFSARRCSGQAAPPPPPPARDRAGNRRA